MIHEYKSFFWNSFDQQKANELGAQGWQLITGISKGDPSLTSCFIFMRTIKADYKECMKRINP